MKKVLALVLVLCMVFALCACGASNSKKLTMGTGGEAGTYYAFGGVLGSYIGQKTDLSINVVSSGGSAANITGIVADNIYDLATVQSDVMTYAFNGTNSFAEKGKMDGFRVLGGLYAETVQIVTCNPDIKTVADLKGKNVCVGDVGSGTFFNTQDILAAYDSPSATRPTASRTARSTPRSSPPARRPPPWSTLRPPRACTSSPSTTTTWRSSSRPAPGTPPTRSPRALTAALIPTPSPSR